MDKNFGYEVSVRPPARTNCRGGGGEAEQTVGKGVFGQFSFVGNRVASLYRFGNPRFSGGKSY